MASKFKKWTTKQLLKLYKLRDEGKTFSEIAKSGGFGCSAGAISSKYRRIKWELFLEDPDGYVEGLASIGDRKISRWADEEMIQLDSYLQAGQSYDFISDKLGRSITSVERQAQTTDWKAWRGIRFAEPVEGETEIDEEYKKKKAIEQYVNALLTICRSDFKRLHKIKESEFLERVNLDKSRLFVTFQELKSLASDKLVEVGFGNPEEIDLGEGRYVIVGDSHGKHTKKDMFSLLKRINKTLKPTKIIHIGHILDDDSDISYDWGCFDNLIILAKVEELKFIQDQRNKFNFNYEIVRESINIKDLVIFNQDLISDYVKTPIKNLDAEIFEDKAIVNCHRQEFFTLCSNEEASYVASPGCLCEQHIVRTIKQMDFEDGRVVKQAFHEGFVKYRKMKHTNRYWEQGILVVEVDKDNNHTIIPCAIRKTSDGYTTSYFDKMISSKRVFKPDRKIFINGDMHCDKHDVRVLDVQEQICKDYKPDVQVNVGDTFNYSCLNHHVMDRGGVIMDKKILDEAASTHYVLKRVSGWAEESYLICGNHERFARDFVEKYPQFGQYLDFKFLCDLDSLGYNIINLKEILKLGPTKFAHGEIRMYGQPGSKLEKASRTFGGDVFIGHIHYPCLRFGCYSIGLSGQLDQDYNEPEASNWLHGFGLCNQYKGKSWSTTVAVVKNKCVIGGKTYKPKNIKSWKMLSYKAKVGYEF
jgi:hypothetical protein